MPQFDTFSFFSQLFWVFAGFSYLYLVLCFYILPAFAVTLKIRAKKLSQIDTSSKSDSLTTSSFDNTLFFDTLTNKLSTIYFYRKSLSNDINTAYSYLMFKNDAIYKFNLLLLNQFKFMSFFV